jgi:hypothetical protein
LGGGPMEWQGLGEGRYRFEVAFERTGDLELKL